MNKRTVAVVQARMGSARFPGKMLGHLGGRPLLEWVLLRVSAASRTDQTLLATSTSPADDVLVEIAQRLGIVVYRGSESDVLGRFVAAARLSDAANVVRVCADNPFIDPAELDRLIDYFDHTSCDYACNHMDRLGSNYADGFGAEIMSMDLLQRVAQEATTTEQREHVTLLLWQDGEYDLRAVPAPPELAHPEMRFDVDVPADLVRLDQLVVSGVSIDTPAARIIELCLAPSE